MRVVVVVFAALLTLGLAAFGVVAAQNANGPISLAALASRVMSATHATNTTPQAAEKAPIRVAEAPVNQLSDATAVAPAAKPVAVAQNTMAAAPALPAAAPAPSAAPVPPPAAKAVPACNNPNALGISRVVEIDTKGGPAFGTEHFKQYDFLRDKEVVFTFDDGPWPDNTRDGAQGAAGQLHKGHVL